MGKCLTCPSYTYTVLNYTYEEIIVKTNLKRKNYYLDQNKILKAKRILGAKTETSTIDCALNLVVFRREILKSLEKVAGKGEVERIF